MNFQQHRPSGELAQHIDVIMFYSGYNPDHSIQRVVPTGNTFLIFELDGYTRHTYNNETLQPDADYIHAWFSGQHKDYMSISAHENSSMLVVQFNAAGAYPFIHQPMDEFTEKVIQADEIFGADIITLRDLVTQGNAPHEKFAIVERWLNNIYDASKKAPDELHTLITQLQQQPVTQFNNIIDNFPHTQKHLIDLFKKHVGITPKYYQRILRFNEIMQRIQHKEKISWTEIAYTCGYSDQSHFIKEFKHFSGFNPQEFIDLSHNDQSNFFAMDREG